jgi:5,6-dimethylbenzimidazole synthase
VQPPDNHSLDHLLRVFAWRRDVRHFQTRAVDAAVLARLIEIAQMAPSVGFSQPWRFVQIESPEARQKIRQNFEHENRVAGDQYEGDTQRHYRELKLSGLDAAPVQLAVFLDKATLRGRGLGQQTMAETAEYSVVMAIHTLWLAAAALGLGVGWVSILDPDAAARSLDAPPEWKFIALLCVGYPEFSSDTPELQDRGWETRDPNAAKLTTV